MRLPSRLFVLAIAAVAGPCLAQSDTRLLPASYTANLSLDWKQDGRALDIKVANQGPKWVIEKILIEVQYSPTVYKEDEYKKLPKRDAKRSTVLPKANNNKSVDWAAGPISWQQEPTITVVTVAIQPGTTGGTHIELAPDSVAKAVSITEARGREQSAYEKIKNYFYQ